MTIHLPVGKYATEMIVPSNQLSASGSSRKEGQKSVGPLHDAGRLPGLSSIGLLLAGFLFLPHGLFPDTVTLKDGRQIFNVRTYVSADYIYVVGKDGATTNLPRRQVKAVAHANVDWSDVDAREKIKRLNEEITRLQGKIRIAILGNAEQEDAATKAFRAVLTSALNKTIYVVLDPGEIKQAVTEQGERSEKDVAADPRKTVALGRLLGVKAVAFIDLDRKTNRLVLRCMEVETGSFVDAAAFSLATEPEKLSAAAENAAVWIQEEMDRAAMTRKLTYAWRSALIPGWGQEYKGESMRAGIILGTTLALGYGIFQTKLDYNRAQSAHAARKKEVFLIPVALDAIPYTMLNIMHTEEARQRQNKYASRGVALIGLTALFWGANVWDAWSRAPSTRTASYSNERIGHRYVAMGGCVRTKVDSSCAMVFQMSLDWSKREKM